MRHLIPILVGLNILAFSVSCTPDRVRTTYRVTTKSGACITITPSYLTSYEKQVKIKGGKVFKVLVINEKIFIPESEFPVLLYPVSNSNPYFPLESCSSY